MTQQSRRNDPARRQRIIDATLAVMQHWMDSSRGALGRFFDPLTARALDALIEGIGIHNSIDRAPVERDAIKTIVERIAGC